MEGAHQKSVTVPMIIDDETFISDRFGVGGGGGGRGRLFAFITQALSLAT